MGAFDDLVPTAAAAPPEAAPGGLFDDLLPGATAAPRIASGPLEALQAGYQGSATGLMVRNRLPDVVLDPQHSKWYERLLATGAQTVSEIPEMALGAAVGGPTGTVAGGAAGSVVPGVGTAAGAAVGGVLGTGFGAFSVPTAIREAYVQALSKGQITSSADFLSRAQIVLKQSAKSGLVGAMTAGAGGVAARATGAAIAPEIGAALTPAAAATRIGAAQLGAEYGTMVVAPSALEGKLPEPEDWLNAAIVIGGFKVAGEVSGRLRSLYSQAGIPPERAAVDAERDPTIREDLAEGPPAPPRSAMDALIAMPDDLPWTTDNPVPKATAELIAARLGVPRAYGEATARAIARDIVPDYRTDERAALNVTAFEAQPTAEVPQQPGAPKVPLNVNYNYLDDPSLVGPTLARISELYGDKIAEQTRGKVSWGETEAASRGALASLVGVQDTSLVNVREPGTAANAVELGLRKALMEGATADLARRAHEFNPDTATDQQRLELYAAAERVRMLSANFQGAAAETARALQYLRNSRAGSAVGERVGDLLDSYPTDAKTLAKMIRDTVTPEGQARVARDYFQATTLDKVNEVWKSGMLSGLKTYMVKAIGDAVNIGSSVVERGVAAGLGLFHGGDKVAPGEVGALVTGMMSGTRDGLKMAAAAWDQRGPFEYKRAIEGPLGEVVAIPHRIMSAETAFFRQLNESGETAALAHRAAVAEDLAPGTREFSERVADLIANPTKEIQDAAKLAGDQGTYTERLGEFGQAIQGVARTKVGQFILPFTTVPGNLLKWAARRMPGVSMVISDVRADLAAGGARRDIAIARQIVGSAVGIAAYSAAQSGVLTGGGHAMTPEERRGKESAGWQPYSVKIGGAYYSYNRFEPMAKIVMLASDIIEMNDRLEGDDRASIPVLVAAMFGNAAISQTYLSGINGLMQALTDPARGGKRFANQFIGSWVPAVLAQVATAEDPKKRMVDDWLDTIKSRLPGLRETLLPRLNPLTGEPEPNNATLTPVNVSSASDDKVLSEAARLGVNAVSAPKSLHLGPGSGKLGRVDLTQQQQSAYDEAAGHLAHQILTPIVNSPSWDGLPDLIQQRTYQKVLARAHQMGALKSMSQEERAQHLRDIGERMTAELAPEEQ